jgi:hypothetical protein
VRGEESRSDTNVTSIYDARHGEPATRKQEPLTDSTHSEIKALLSLLLLQHGASSKEILTTLRMAAAAAARMTDDEQAEPEQTADEEGKREPEKRAHTPKQALRNEQLAPIAKVVRAA